MQRPGAVEEDGTGGEPPVVYGPIKDYEKAVPDAKDKLHFKSETERLSVHRSELTSIRMSLCSRTPRRIFASVMQLMMMRAPTIKP